MKKWIRQGILGFLILCCCLIFSFQSVKAKEPIDRIHDYSIVVRPEFKDGSLDMTYSIMWEVLDDEKEGPLTWVKVGIPNKYVENIQALSDNIENIRYSSSGGDFIRIDFKDKYYAGETVTFSFSFRQHSMYRTDEKEQTRVYEFTPGWFDEIDVNCMRIIWPDMEVVNYSPNMEKYDGYYIYMGDMPAGQRINVSLTYDRNSFEQEDIVKKIENESTLMPVLLFFFGLPALVFLIRFLIYRKKGLTDSYTEHSGMGSHYYNNHSSHSGHAGGGCACACACACAGGGRAGCSKKDFYGVKMEIKRLYK